MSGAKSIYLFIVLSVKNISDTRPSNLKLFEDLVPLNLLKNFLNIA